ncbi:MAG: TonB-dependent receptor [Rhodospirillaceae bacterium]|nr:TonB-dependent receptor [Rhodospirillaceae bacterium]
MTPSPFKSLRAALLISVALMGAPAVAQETAGQINGVISDASGTPLANAQVRIVHTPSGTVQTATTNAEGRFIGRGLRLGGPYEVTVSSGGTNEKVQENVFLVLGEPYALDYKLGAPQMVEELVVTGVRVREQASGPSTQFDRDRIVSGPTVTRDLKDILRGDPKVYIDRFNSDAVQIAGTNNRFNLLTIDGVRNSDDFGLNNGGYPGLRAPVSLDVIDQLSVNIAPYAVTYSGFQGGNVNIVTKSGTNDFTGSAYYYYSDDSLLGNNSGARPVVGLTFKDKTYGATLGGPIIEDKLFIFAGYEKFTTGNPVTTGPAGGGFSNEITQISQAFYNQVKSAAQSVYGYDILDLDKSLPESDEKIFAKLNWNITDEHRLQVSYNRGNGNVVVSPGPRATISAARTLAAGSNWYDNTQTVDSISGQLFSDWSDAFKTEVKVGYVKKDALPTPRGKVPFAEMQVRTSSLSTAGVLAFGPDQFRHFNVLNTENLTFKLKGDYLIGDHTVTAGVEREQLDVFNAFLAQSYGIYHFNSLADFQARNAQRLDFQFAVSGNINDAAAEFNSDITSFYVQDSWEMTPELTVVAGLRRESYSSDTQPALNTRFQQRYGFANTETFDGRGLWLPRLSFTYDFSDDLVLRGGVGLFGGGTPNVWLSNNYSNTGVQTSSTVITRPAAGVPLTALQATALNNVTGLVPAAVLQSLVAGDGNANALDPNFKIPSTWKASLGFDQTFDLGMAGNDYSLRADLIYSEVKQAQNWIDLRLVQTGTTPDGRPIYGRRTLNPVLPAAGNDMLLTNTSGGRGWVASLQLAKEWDTNIGRFNLEVGYTWQDITDVNPGTSSVAFSNFAQVARQDINNPEESTSNYEIKHNGIIAGQWTEEFWGDYETSISLFGQARTGRPFSYTFAGTSPVFGDPAQGGFQRQLFYVPKDANDVNLAGGLTYAQLDAYIIENGLDKYRGQIAPRNAFRSPSVATVDMRFSQQIPGLFEGTKGVFTMDIRNLTNLINSSWGREIQQDFPFVVPVVEATSIAGGKYTYSGAPRTKNRSLLARQSVWAIQFGARYEF